MVQLKHMQQQQQQPVHSRQFDKLKKAAIGMQRENDSFTSKVSRDSEAFRKDAETRATSRQMKLSKCIV